MAYVEIDLGYFSDAELLRECESRGLIAKGAAVKASRKEPVAAVANPIDSPNDFYAALAEISSHRYGEALIYLERAMPCINGICHALHIVH